LIAERDVHTHDELRDAHAAIAVAVAYTGRQGDTEPLNRAGTVRREHAPGSEKAAEHPRRAPPAEPDG
jgi:hypothetical protein